MTALDLAVLFLFAEHFYAVFDVMQLTDCPENRIVIGFFEKFCEDTSTKLKYQARADFSARA